MLCNKVKCKVSNIIRCWERESKREGNGIKEEESWYEKGRGEKMKDNVNAVQGEEGEGLNGNLNRKEHVVRGGKGLG